jgi:hypothetical protein
MPDTTYWVEAVMIDPKSGEPLRTRQRGDAYPTRIAAERAAAKGDHGLHWIVVEECIVAIAPAVAAIMQEQAA